MVHIYVTRNRIRYHELHFNRNRYTMQISKVIDKIILFGHLSCISAGIDYQQSSNISEITIGVLDSINLVISFFCWLPLIETGLTEISKAQNANSINIFASKNSNVTDIDDIIKYIHQSSELKTCIFYDFEQYFQNIEQNQKGFIETTSLIFAEPFYILHEVSIMSLGVLSI